MINPFLRASHLREKYKANKEARIKKQQAELEQAVLDNAEEIYFLIEEAATNGFSEVRLHIPLYSQNKKRLEEAGYTIIQAGDNFISWE